MPLEPLLTVIPPEYSASNLESLARFQLNFSRQHLQLCVFVLERYTTRVIRAEYGRTSNILKVKQPWKLVLKVNLPRGSGVRPCLAARILAAFPENLTPTQRAPDGKGRHVSLYSDECVRVHWYYTMSTR